MDVNKATYLKYLRMANMLELKPTSELADMELKLVRQLIKAGLLADSDDRFLSVAETNVIVLTPEGAIALSAWEKEEKESTILYKVGDGLLRTSWIIVGVLISAIVKWLNI